MAQEALEKLEEELNCSICLDTFTNPKELQCFHVYCQQCLVPLVVRDQQGQLGLSCPACRQVTPIPARGVAGLQSAFHINCFLEIKESFQKVEYPAATPEGASPGDVSPVKEGNHCSVHEGKELELYCETCGELVCYKCVIKSGKHHDHDYEELYDAFTKYQEEMSRSLKPLDEQVVTIKRALAQLDVCYVEISDQRAATANNIHRSFRRLQEALRVRETQLISRLDQISQGKLKGLAVQRDQIETTLAQLSSCLHFVRKRLGTGTKGDVLKMKTKRLKQVKQLIISFQCDILKPITEADIVFTASADMRATCHEYGQVFASGALDPSKCHVTGKGAEAAVVGEKATAVLQAIDFKGEPCEEPIKSLECKLVSELTGIEASCGVERRGQSQYEISYHPTIKGRHQLHIKVGDQHVRGSPLTIAVKSSLQKLGTPILTVGEMAWPWGVAVTQRGEVVMTESRRHCVSVRRPFRKESRSFGTLGSSQGQFFDPCGVAVDLDGNILVVEFGNHRIQKFTLDSQFLTAVGTVGSGPLQFLNPIGIAFNATNHMVYVADTFNHRIQILNSDLTFSSTFGKEGSSKGQFKQPRGISCDSTGKVYVADSCNHRIQVFKAEGKFLRKFGRCGQGRGELQSPTGVAIDTDGMVYVSEEGNHRVSVFTAEGQFVTSFGRKGEGPGEYCSPQGIAVDTSGVVYVCDQGNRVQLL